HTVSASETQCVIPAMTAGRYFARASGASTASAAAAVQQLTIAAGEESCVSTRNPDPKAPWAVGTRRAFYAGCLFTVVSDAPVTVTAVYLDAKATKDPKGPTLTVTPAPWGGVLGALPVKMRQ
ncbi:MAG: hypothetical protein ACREEQ_12300, partial [Caulobacteraceae bacterium]